MIFPPVNRKFDKPVVSVGESRSSTTGMICHGAQMPRYSGDSGYTPVDSVKDLREILKQFENETVKLVAGGEFPGSGARVNYVRRSPIVESEKTNFESDGSRQSPSASEAVAIIRSALSLQVKELAEILQVERPTVYAWIDGSSNPQQKNRARLRQILRLANSWNMLSNYPMSRTALDMDEDGISLIDCMAQKPIHEELILGRFRSIAQVESRRQKKRHSIREFAKEHGIDLSKVRDQQDQLDVLTGKRFTMD